MNNHQGLVSVAVDIPARKNFTYQTDVPLFPGQRVRVPFGKRKMVGWVIGQGFPGDFQCKKVLKVYDEFPLIPEHLLLLAQKMADMYFSSVGSILAMMTKNLSLRKINVSVEQSEDTEKTHLKDPVAEMVLNEMEVTRKKICVVRFNTGEEKSDFFRAIVSRIDGSCLIVFSNNTDAKKCADVLKDTFRNRIIFFTGQPGKTEKTILWHQMLKRKNLIIIGTRTALFSPVSDLKMIVVDEPGEYGHKETRLPRYNSREIALTISQISEIPVIFTTFQPDVQDIFFARTQKAIIVESKKEIKFPQISISPIQGKKTDILTDISKNMLEKCVIENKKVVIVHNLKGYARLILCKKCGKPILCNECGQVLVPVSDNYGFCRNCRKFFSIPEKCPSCKKGFLSIRQPGIQKIAQLLKKMYPEFTIGTISEKNVNDFNSQIIIGTQHIIQYLKQIAPHLLIFTNADMIAARNEFRSEEKFFLLAEKIKMMMSGENIIIIQTRNPGLDVYGDIVRNDEKSFYNRELSIREKLGFPPYQELIEIRSKSRNWEKNKSTFFDSLREYCDIYEILSDKTKAIFLCKTKERQIFFNALEKIADKYKINIVSVDVCPYF